MVSLSFDLVDDIATLTFSEEIPVGKCVLSITYVGEHNNQMAGFYRSSYTGADGTKKTMVSTQLEAIDARRLLPCWDEPAAKATFACKLVVAKGLTALSNMPVKTLVQTEEKAFYTFETTPKMSSYLLAFCVGEFDFVGGTSKNGVQMRCYTPPGKAELGRFALDVGLKTLDNYDAFFDVPYPLPKMDMIAIPEFAMGAMENWGLVTYREVDLLIDPATATASQKQRVCTVVTHELAHQWFGNLVTMEWWSALWLNESFACWTQSFAADLIFPEWKMWQNFICTDMARARSLDALKSSHPIEVRIYKAEEVEQVFDAISYCKGGCVVRMAYETLGAEAFKEGLRIYMKRHAYGTPVPSDLGKAWAEASGKDVPSLMASWTEQMGYPLLTLHADGKVTQRWFLADGSTPDEKKTWSVPMFVSIDGAPTKEIGLMTKEEFAIGEVATFVS